MGPSVYLSIPSVKVTVMVMRTVHQACCMGPSVYLSIPSVVVTVMVMSTVHQACCVGPSVYLSIPSVKVTVMVMILSTRLVVWVHLSIYLYHLLR